MRSGPAEVRHDPPPGLSHNLRRRLEWAEDAARRYRVAARLIEWELLA